MSLLKKIFLINAGLGIFALGVLSGLYIPSLDKSNPSEQNISARYKSLPDYTQDTREWEKHTITDFPKLSFKFPNDWQSLSFWDPMPSNAYGAESPNLKTYSSFQGITEGSILTFSVSPLRGYEYLTLEQIAVSISEGTLVELEYYLVANIPSIKFKHYCCENSNTEEVLMFIRNGYLYQIVQRYEKYGSNPYPSIVEKVGSAVIFED